MTIKAVKGFSGFTSAGERFAMFPGEVREVKESDTVRELLSIGYLKKADKPAEIAPEQTEVQLNETKRGKSKRN